MKPLDKGLLIGGTVLLLIGAIMIVATGRSARENVSATQSEGWALEGAGIMFGRNVSESQCLTEAVTRYQADTGLWNAIEQTNFIRGCSWTSKIDPDFCTDVPSNRDSPVTVEWRASRCRTLGLGEAPRCPLFLQEIQSHCHGTKRQQKLAAAR